MKKFFEELKKINHILFKENFSDVLIQIRLWLAFKLLPKDFANLFKLLISTLSKKYDELDSEKKSKITSLTIDFEYRK